MTRNAFNKYFKTEICRMLAYPFLLSRKTRSKLLYHLLFWVTLVLSFSFENIALYHDLGVGNYLLLLLGRILSIGFTIYINIQVGIPLLLRRKKYFLYAVLVLVSIGLLMITASFFNFLATKGLLDTTPSYSGSLFLTYLFTGLRIVFLSYLLYIAMEWIDQKFLLKEISIEKLQAEKLYLKSQLNPHFLFNTLNNLHGLVLTNKALASESLLRFADFLQYMVYTTEAKRIPLQQELQLIQDYLALERLRLPADKTITLDIQISDYNYTIAPLLLLPLVENAVKHGLNTSGKGGFLYMNIQAKTCQLLVSLSNSKGVTIASETRGVGLRNLKRRLVLEYPNQHSLSIQDEKQIYSAHLQISLDAI